MKALGRTSCVGVTCQWLLLSIVFGESHEHDIQWVFYVQLKKSHDYDVNVHLYVRVLLSIIRTPLYPVACLKG